MRKVSITDIWFSAEKAEIYKWNILPESLTYMHTIQTQILLSESGKGKSEQGLSCSYILNLLKCKVYLS